MWYSIARVLDKRKALRYSDLIKETNVGLSSDLAFHIRRLIAWDERTEKS